VLKDGLVIEKVELYEIESFVTIGSDCVANVTFFWSSLLINPSVVNDLIVVMIVGLVEELAA
jgi:hypothetical protein